MKSVKVLLAALFLSAILFVSCSPSSVADEDDLYKNEQGVDKNEIRIPTHG